MGKLIALLNCHGDDVFCFRREIIEALVDRNYKVIISCPESSRLDYFRNKENIFIEDIKIDRRGTNIKKDLYLLVQYIQLYKKYKPDAVCTFTIKPNIYGSIAADILKIPHINNITGLGSGFQNGGLIKNIVKILYKVALSKSEMVFFQNSENEKIAIESGMISKRTKHKCIPGSGVNLTRFQYQPKEENEILTFNYIGRVLKDKRIDDYFSAAVRIKQKYTNVRFNVIGFVEPTEKKYIKLLEKLESENVINYCGNVEDIRPYIVKSDAIIHPSSYGEGMSNVLLETAACGRTIITTNIPGCREVVDDGINGYVYDPEDVDQLVEKIERYMHLSCEERRKMGLLGRKKVENSFDRNIVVENYWSVLEDV